MSAIISTNISEKLEHTLPDSIRLYSQTFGYVIVHTVTPSRICCYREGDDKQHPVQFNNFGQQLLVTSDFHNTQEYSVETLLWPDENTRDWDSFILDENKDLPASWDEFLTVAKDIPAVEYNGQKVSSVHPKLDTLEKLVLLRNYYNGSWCPDYNNADVKFAITRVFSNDTNRLSISSTWNIPHLLTFKTNSIAEKFLRSFKNMIEECQEFI